MPADNAAHGRADDAVMAGIMSGHAADHNRTAGLIVVLPANMLQSKARRLSRIALQIDAAREINASDATAPI